MDESESGWFSFDPEDPAAFDRLTPDQQRMVRPYLENRARQPGPVGEIHVVLRGLGPGQAQIRYGGSGQASALELLRAAIRELTVAAEKLERQ
ncbi:hypothetical protein [Pseudonocardia acidicola]|uniref:Uncharacterized protein n=1 Tax=Pseudonocardia acidicola TaxID=2724939 RepID=A0ABX1SLH5_9PSEU|nr:hypothetical protein [Pseudonocardia acidicola]NMI01267.1 hypothetical protein [Pseudonocardia acidicola]